MFKLFLLCLMLMMPLAHAQNVEDAPLEDVPAIALPTPEATAQAPSRKRPQPTASPKSVISSDAPRSKESAIENKPLAAATAATPTHQDEFGHSHEEHHDTIDDVRNTQSENTQSWFDLQTTFASDWMQRALLAGILVALLCGFLGVYVVLRRVVFVGVALAELSSAGIALGLLLGFAPIAGALAFMAAGVVLFSLRWSPRRVPHESVIGIVYLLSAALGVLLIAKSAQGETFMLKLLQGDVLLIDTATVTTLGIAAAGIGIAHALFGKEFVLVSFDRESAATLGLRASAWELFLTGTIGLAIAFSIHAVGVLLTASLLVLPAATALLLARSLRTAFLLAPLLATVPVVLGLHISFVADYPASAVVVVLSVVLFLAALAGRRGQ